MCRIDSHRIVAYPCERLILAYGTVILFDIRRSAIQIQHVDRVKIQIGLQTIVIELVSFDSRQLGDRLADKLIAVLIFSFPFVRGSRLTCERIQCVAEDLTNQQMQLMDTVALIRTNLDGLFGNRFCGPSERHFFVFRTGVFGSPVGFAVSSPGVCLLLGDSICVEEIITWQYRQTQLVYTIAVTTCCERRIPINEITGLVRRNSIRVKTTRCIPCVFIALMLANGVVL